MSGNHRSLTIVVIHIFIMASLCFMNPQLCSLRYLMNFARFMA